jgi:hypothetical protein
VKERKRERERERGGGERGGREGGEEDFPTREIGLSSALDLN